MRRQIITPGHLTRLPLIAVFYEPQAIQTVAIQVTPETIGAMSIEFGVEISVSHPNHKFLPAMFERLSGKDEACSIERTIFYGEWLVVLNGEVLVFPADTFWNTFSQDKPAEHAFEAQLDERIMSSEQLARELGIDIPTGPKKKLEFMNLPPELQHQEKDLPDQSI
jgi:hypothetical protein